MYVDQMDGLNIGKAIGRALGAGGRAALSFVPGIGAPAASALEAAAKGKQAPPLPPPPAPVQSATPSAPTAPVSTTQPSPTLSPSDELMKLALTKFITSAPASPPPPPPPPPAPSAPSTTIIDRGGSSTAPAPAAMPSWAIPAMIGAVGLMFVMSQQRR